jgi:hypothetical protein
LSVSSSIAAREQRLDRVPVTAVANREALWHETAQLGQMGGDSRRLRAGLFTAMMPPTRLRRPTSAGLNRKCVVLGLS